MDRFDAMLAFTRVVELSSFTKAAASLALPKTTLSAQVLALETHLHVKLLHRTTRNISVTADGAAFYERAKILLADLEEAEAAVSNLVSSPRGKLRVGIPGALGRRVVLPAIGGFTGRYPDIELEIGCTDRQVDLLQEGMDCVIRGGQSVDETLVARRLQDFRMVTCASPIYLKEFGRPETPDDLAKHQIVYYTSPRTGKNHALAYHGEKGRTEVPGRARIAVNDSDGCIEAAVAGLGIVQLPEFIACDYLASGRLTELLDGYTADPVAVSILYPRNRHLSMKVRAFVDWSVELFAAAGRKPQAALSRPRGPRQARPSSAPTGGLSPN